jgi:hypothetical protein
MKTLPIWILAVILTHDGPVIRMQVPSCEALHDWTLRALAWHDRSKLHTNFMAVCYWQEKV